MRTGYNNNYICQNGGLIYRDLIEKHKIIWTNPNDSRNYKNIKNKKINPGSHFVKTNFKRLSPPNVVKYFL